MILMFILTGTLVCQAQTYYSASSDSAAIHFHQSKWNLDLSLGDNAAVLDSIHRKLTVIQGDSIYRIRNVRVIGGASPEGPVKFNQFLSEHRAQTLFDHFKQYSKLEDADMSFTFLGRDWDGVLRLAILDPKIPYRNETIALLEKIAAEKRATGKEPINSLGRLKQLRGGVPYLYLYKNIFPTVRASKIILDYDRYLSPAVAAPLLEETVLSNIDSIENDLVVIPDTLPVPPTTPVREKKGPFYMDIRTNMLFDAVLIPNIGVEFYLGKNWTVVGDWQYGWWKTDRKHIYWRFYGGDIAVRKWFGKEARRKPLTGHHLGAYAQIYTYDIDLGGDGQLGGKPGGNLWDRYHWGAGVEYGYSLPVGKRLNIDFSIGAGYTTGYYYVYKPIDDHYVWQYSGIRHWFGPTKAEISLAWLIGRDNYNERKKKKGGGE